MISKLNMMTRGRRVFTRGFCMLLLLGVFTFILPLLSWSQEDGAADATPSVEQLQKQLVAAKRDAARQERHLRSFLFPAYVIIWLLLFGYIRYVAQKERDLAQQVEDLRRRMEKRQ
jgi:CcmD family protein